MVNISLGSNAIYNYGIYRDCIELRCGGTVITVSDSDEIAEIKRWIKRAKVFAKNKCEVCTYLEYMLDFGQYEEGYDEH